MEYSRLGRRWEHFDDRFLEIGKQGMSASGNTDSPRLTEDHGAVCIPPQTLETLYRVMEKFLGVVSPVEESEPQGNGQQREQVEGERGADCPIEGIPRRRL